MQKKWADRAAMNKLAELEQFRPASGGCEVIVDIDTLRLASRPPTRTTVLSERHLLNVNAQKDADVKRAELLKNKLIALELANKRRADCLLRKETLDREFRVNAHAKRQQKDEAHVRAISRLQKSRPASRAKLARSPSHSHDKEFCLDSRCGSSTGLTPVMM